MSYFNNKEALVSLYERNMERRQGGFDKGSQKMHKAKCSDCGKDCEVPFKPTEGKPVYCKDCYQKRRKY